MFQDFFDSDVRTKVRWRFCKILWPSQNIWILPVTKIITTTCQTFISKSSNVLMTTCAEKTTVNKYFWSLNLWNYFFTSILQILGFWNAFCAKTKYFTCDKDHSYNMSDICIEILECFDDNWCRGNHCEFHLLRSLLD